MTVKANECLKTEVAASQHKANMFDFLLFFFMKKSSSLIFPSSHSFTVALSIGQLSLHRVLGFFRPFIPDPFPTVSATREYRRERDKMVGTCFSNMANPLLLRRRLFDLFFENEIFDVDERNVEAKLICLVFH